MLAGYAAIVFASRPVVGACVLAASMTAPGVGLAGLLALVAGTATARALGYRADAIAHGYYGYNALLVGLALGYTHPWTPALAAFVVLGGGVTAVLTAVLGDLLQRALGLPVLALPFVLVASLLGPALVALAAPPDAGLDLGLALPPVVDLGLRALGAVVFAPTVAGGACVLVALIASSRIAAALAVLGLAVGQLVVALVGAPLPLGPCYNAALAAAMIGAVSFVPGRAAVVAAALAAALTAWLAVAMPLAYAWPFTLVCLVVIRGLHLRAPDRAPFPALLPGASPERNVEYAAGRRRFGLPGPPQLALPFYGTWVIAQGTHGAHTHQPPWADALDFEAVDDQGFPFRGDGRQLEDYRCFGLPVVAPVAGLVVAVHDGVPDNAPGEVDTARPWGNAIVISAGPELYVVLAHLRLGSARVAPGQTVVVGQALAACGSSGRSPRPHLHVQVQRTPELGAPAVPFRFAHYVVTGADVRRYVAVGLPAEGERLSRPAANPRVEAFTALAIGEEMRFALEPRGELRVRSEIGLHGERSLRDLDRGDRLYFTAEDGHLVFTAHDGATGAPLRALFHALPRLPSVAGPLELTDQPPPSGLLSWPARALHDVARVVGDPIETRATIAVREVGETVVVTTTTHVGWRGRVRPRYRGTIEIDHAGLRALELIDERRRGAVVLRARRTA